MSSFDKIDVAILKVLLEPDPTPNGKKFKEISDKVWPKIEGVAGVTETSFRNVILNRKLTNLDVNSELVTRTEKSPKSVFYKLRNNEAAKQAIIIVKGSPPEMLEAFVSFLRAENKAEELEAGCEVPLDVIGGYFNFSKTIIASCSLKMLKAISDQNNRELTFYIEQGKEHLSSLFEAFVYCIMCLYSQEGAKDSSEYAASLLKEEVCGLSKAAKLSMQWFDDPGNISLLTQAFNDKYDRLKEYEKMPVEERQRQKEKIKEHSMKARESNEKLLQDMENWLQDPKKSPAEKDALLRNIYELKKLCR